MSDQDGANRGLHDLRTGSVQETVDRYNRLFEEVAVASPATNPTVADLFEERDRLMRSKTDCLNFYGRLKDFPRAVSPEAGTLLHMLARAAKARNIVEFGTSFGISPLPLAATLRDNGGSRLVTPEFDASKAARARENLTATGPIDLVDIREGDALQTLSFDLPTTIDLLLLDGAKALYSEILSLAESRLRPHAFLAADDADYSPDYLAHVRSPAKDYMSVPFTDGVELSMRIG